MRPELEGIKALTFDVFGTVVDFRGSIIRECRKFGKERGLRVNWTRFADAWRVGYRPAMDRVGRSELPWDCVFSAETFRHYKPDPETYLGAAALLDLKPGEVMMVAAHKHDLRAAARHGLKTAFVRRPHEHGRNRGKDLEDDPAFTVNADEFLDLADQLGC